MTLGDGMAGAVVERAVAIVPVRDLERSMDFYRQLGFAVEVYEDGGYAFLSRDAAQIHLRLAEGELEGRESACGVYLYVADADEVYEAWLAGGISVLHEPTDQTWRMREFAVSDPDGTLLRVGHRLPG